MLNDLIANTVPVIDKKLKENYAHEEIEMKKSQYRTRTLDVWKKNKESRIINERQVFRSK